ncbi:hypothetical protein B0H15DRAFT_649212 [Mycena belliarum]|uniref:Uncharacterized protein n=1 Tax=Mycena belliarum TaxID=1033014 RepID=A0AAD6TS05_9AGAR|nr:hypothetical protein B0H15DRAFT_649212 [Mycena belliae]
MELLFLIVRVPSCRSCVPDRLRHPYKNAPTVPPSSMSSPLSSPTPVAAPTAAFKATTGIEESHLAADTAMNSTLAGVSAEPDPHQEFRIFSSSDGNFRLKRKGQTSLTKGELWNDSPIINSTQVLSSYEIGCRYPLKMRSRRRASIKVESSAGGPGVTGAGGLETVALEVDPEMPELQDVCNSDSE